MEAAHRCLQLLDVYLHIVVSFCLVNHVAKKRTQIVLRMALEVPIDACSKNSWEPPTQSPRRMAVTLPKPNFQGMCLRKWMECNVGSFQHSQDPVSKFLHYVLDETKMHFVQRISLSVHGCEFCNAHGA